MITTLAIAWVLAVSPPVREISWDESFAVYDEPIPLQQLVDQEARAFQLAEEDLQELLAEPKSVFAPLEIEAFYEEKADRAPSNRERQRWADFLQMQSRGMLSVEERFRVVVPPDQPRLERFAGEFVVAYFYDLNDFDKRVMELGENGRFDENIELWPLTIPAEVWDRATPAQVTHFATSLEFVVREFVERTGPEVIVAAMLEQEALNQMKMAGTAMIILVADHEDTFPSDMQLERDPRLLPYSRDASAWDTLNPNGGEVHFNLALRGRSLNDLGEITRTPMFYDSTPWPDGSRIVVFADTSVRRVSAEEWPAVRARILAPGDV